MVTVVSIFSGEVAVSKIPSPSSRPTRERAQSQGGIPAGGDCRSQYKPELLDAAPRITLVNGGMAALFLLPNGRV